MSFEFPWSGELGKPALSHNLVSAELGSVSPRHRPVAARHSDRVRATVFAPSRPLSVVVYHHLACSSDAFTEKLKVTTSPDVFREHVCHFGKNYDLITPRDLEAGKLPKRPLLITFDDAYRSVCDVAAPILREFGAEALFFINPGVVLDRLMPTDNLLALAATVLGDEEMAKLIGCTIRPVPSLHRLLMTVVPKLPTAELKHTRQALLDRLGYSDAELCARSGLFMEARHLAGFAAYGLHAANHTMTHRTLRYLSADELRTEIHEAKRRIETATGQTVRWLSVPYGSQSDATPEMLSVAAESGHAGVFLVQGRLNRFRPAPDVFYRVSPRNLRASMLPVSLTMLPALRSLRHAARFT